MTEANEQEQLEKPATTTVGKKTTKGSGDLIADTASEVEGLTKAKALAEATKLADNIESNYFKLGGVLKVIHDQAWFEGYESFDVFVSEKFGFKARKARYLMDIYNSLVVNQISWDKVQHLGWTKLKDLAPVLTADNVDEWVAKAEKVTVAELQAMLSKKPEGSTASAKTTSDVTKISFGLKNDQVETVQSALNKAKAEVNTEFDNVAIEMICAGYLGGNQIAKPSAASVEGDPVESLKALMQGQGWQAVLELYGTLFPFVDIDVTGVDEEAAALAALNAV